MTTKDEAREAMKRAHPVRSICEVLREIYWATENEIVRDRALDAMVMAKKMDTKLRSYNPNWAAGVYGPNTDRDDDKKTRGL